MAAEADFQAELERAMHDDAGLLAAMRALLERTWAFVADSSAGERRPLASFS